MKESSGHAPTMPMFCATCDQINEWLTRFKENTNPEDLVIIHNPKLYLSCRVGGSTKEAYACYGDGLAEVIESSEDVYNIAELNCASLTDPEYEIKSMIIGLTNIRRQLPEGSPSTEAYFQANHMLMQLNEQRHLFDLGRWEEIINGLAGAQERPIQDALKLATDLHALWANQPSN